jgi:hypothetical protein
MAKYPSEREPAKIAKCPHCKWTGSARGLFSHVRLAHGGKEHSLKIRAENPYLIEKSKPKVLGSVINKKRRVNNDDWLETLIVACIVRAIESYNQSQKKAI